MRRFVVALALLSAVLLLCSLPASAADIAVKQVGQYGGACRAVTVAGNKAYVGEGPRLVVFDISNPSTPVKIGSTAPLAGTVGRIAVSGHYAFVLDQSYGMQVVDIANPAAPIKVSEIRIPNFGMGLAISGNYAYVEDVSTGFAVVNISDPMHPTIAGSCQAGRPGDIRVRDIAVSGGYAYVATTYGLEIYDLSNPARPMKRVLFSVSSPGRVAVSGNRAYVAGGWQNLAIGGFCSSITAVDITDPSRPLKIATCSARVGDIAVVGNTLYAAGEYSVDAIDASGTTGLMSYSHCHPVGKGFGVAVSNGYAYVANDYGGLYTIAIPSTNPHVGRCATSSPSNVIAKSGNYVYSAGYSGSLDIVDISVPSKPVKTGRLQNTYQYGDIAVSGNYVYLPHDGYLDIVNVSNPAAPTVAKSYGVSEYCSSVAFSGNYALVTIGSGVVVLDISNPIAPTKVSEYKPGPTTGFWLVRVSGTHAFAVNNNRLQVLDISNPACLAEQGSWWSNRPILALEVSGNYAFVTDSTGLSVIDASNPSNPVCIGKCSILDSSFTGLAVAGSRAYVSVCPPNSGTNDPTDRGIYVVDVADPSNPVAMGVIKIESSDPSQPYNNVWGEPYDLVVDNELAYIAADASGVQILRVPEVPVMTPTCSYDTSGSVKSVQCSDRYAYAQVYDDGIEVLDVSTPSRPHKISTYSIAGLTDMVKVGSRLYAVTATDFYVLDLTNPSNLTLLGKVAGGGSHLRVNGNKAYVLGGLLDQYFSIIDITSASNPVRAGSCSATALQGPMCFGIYGDFAYFGGYGKNLTIVDCSVAAHPVVIGTYSTSASGSIIDIEVCDSYAYLLEPYSSTTDHIEVLSLADPSHPTSVKTSNVASYAYDISISSNYLCVGPNRKGIEVFDTANPANPCPVGNLTPRGRVMGTVILGNNAYVATDAYGVSVFSIGYDTPSACKSARDGAPAMVGGAVVTASFADHFYIESLNRTSGIRVDRTGYTAEKGSLVSVEGTISTNADGERFISSLADPVKAGTGEVKPLYVRCDLIGGGAFGAFSGADEGVGLNNTGILIRTCGKVVEMEPVEAPYKPKWFKISDGSKSIIKCIATEGVTIDPSWAGVTVTGISSCEKVDGKVVPVVRVRNLEDIASF